jgi:cytochrome c biogenesis protein CcmG, thiol:disulfide interchange protein DsbE
MKRLRIFLWVLVAVVGGLFVLFGYQLTQPKDEFIQSAMVGESLPEFDLRPAIEGMPGLSKADLADGKPRLVNIFASWCVPCRAEAPQLETLRAAGADIVGIAIRDRPEDVAMFLQLYGNPFTAIGADDISQVQLELGSSGVPETFVIDGNGVITYQHIGDIRPEHVQTLLYELREAGA